MTTLTGVLVTGHGVSARVELTQPLVITPWGSHRGDHTVGITPWGSHRGDHTVGITPWGSHRGDHTVGITPWGSHRTEPAAGAGQPYARGRRNSCSSPQTRRPARGCGTRSSPLRTPSG